MNGYQKVGCLNTTKQMYKDRGKSREPIQISNLLRRIRKVTQRQKHKEEEAMVAEKKIQIIEQVLLLQHLRRA